MCARSHLQLNWFDFQKHRFVCFAGPVDAPVLQSGDSQLNATSLEIILPDDNGVNNSSPTSANAATSKLLRRTKRRNNGGTCDVVGSPDYLYSNDGQVDVSNWSRGDKCDRS